MFVNSQIIVVVAFLFSISSALLATSFAPLAAFSTLAAFAATNILLVRNTWGALLSRPVDFQWLGLCVLAALALLVIGGEGHVFFAKDDWLYRDAVLSDLTDHWLPTVYAIDSQNWILRAPLGMYLLPAGVGHLFGLSAAHIALLFQNSAILGGFFYVVTLIWRKARPLFLALFVLFSGLDVIPCLIKTDGQWLPVNLSFWVDFWNYASNASQLFWNPNHTLPGWWFAALVVLYLRKEIDLGSLAVATAPLALWSPMTMMGAVPICGALAMLAWRSACSLRMALCGIAICGFVPVLVYLGLDAQSVQHEWLVFKDGFFDQYSWFVVFAFPQAAFVLIFWNRLEPWFKTTMIISILVILVVPVYSVGTMNDFSQRVAIVPRAFLAFGFNALLIDILATGKILAAAAGLSLTMVGAVTPALEFYDSLSTPRFSASNCNLATVHKKLHPRIFLSTYFARLDAAPDWLLRKQDSEAAPFEDVSRICWSDRVYGERLFNWLKPENRIWLRPRQTSDASSQSPRD